jgi:hypothetical protein
LARCLRRRKGEEKSAAVDVFILKEKPSKELSSAKLSDKELEKPRYIVLRIKQFWK